MLQRYDRDGVELIINTQTGESFASQAGYARMANVDYKTIRNRVYQYKQTRPGFELKIAEIPTTTGLKQVTLIEGKLACEWLAKDNPELLTKMSQVGWNVYCHKLAGFEISSTAIQKEDSELVKLVFDKMSNLESMFLKQEKELKQENKMLKGSLIIKEKIIDDFVEEKKELEEVYKKVPGLERAIAAIRENPNETRTITLAEFCEKYGFENLTHGERISIGKTVAGFCRLAELKNLAKSSPGQTLYPVSFLNLLYLAVGIHRGLNK